MRPESRRDIVRASVKESLRRSSAFRSLPAERQQEIVSGTAAVASTMAEVEGATVTETDFPAFVADLIRGTFEALVDASIEQMEAYGEMLAGVSQSLDQFRKDAVSDSDAQAWLAATVPGLGDTGEVTADLALEAARHHLAKKRQKFLATMMRAGVCRALDCD